MAANTPASCRQLVIYEVFVRNHSADGTLAALTADLPRLKALGVDVVWLMPIHPIGQARRKGSFGSPYAIADYRAVHPDYGSERDLAELADAAHSLGLKLMIDVVYNHTSPDSVLAQGHPGWFYHDAAGQPFPRHAGWSDVVDLRHPNPALTDYLIEALLKWVRLGVDGFRCDVASLVPLEFWRQARQAVAKIKPDFIWLAESVHLHFVRSVRRQGHLAHSDAELYAAFDITYDYDIHHLWRECVRGQRPLRDYAAALEWQEASYPANFIKLRFAENHDQPRIAGLLPTPAHSRCWTALMAFLPGAFLIYDGQETGTPHLPALFEKDPIAWPAEPPLSNFLSRLAALKKHPATAGQFDVLAAGSHFQARWQGSGGQLYGLFNVNGVSEAVSVQLPDGRYTNLLDDQPVTVSDGRLSLPPEPVIVAA